MSDRFPTTGPNQLHGAGPTGHVKPLHEEDFSALDRAVSRTRATDAPDLRSQARKSVDELHALIESNCIEAHGRAPSMDSWAQPSDQAAVLLRRAQDAEARFVNAASIPGTPPEHVQELRQACADAFSLWMKSATAGWPSAKAYKASRRKDDDLRTGTPSSRGDFARGGRR